MRFPLNLHYAMARSFVGNTIKGVKRSPLVLMLEPTHRCNLACAGCDRIRLYNETMPADLTLDECIASVIESNAPVVTITGGEPLLYPDLKPLIEKILALKRHVYLCSNGLLAESFIEQFEPRPGITLNFHVDGMEETHDRVTCRPGMFKKVIEVITKAKQKGFRVSTNTSVFRNTDTAELEKLFTLLTKIGVNGILISPAFSYERVQDDIFLSRDEVIERFGRMADMFQRFSLMNSPVYLDFLMGKRQMNCTPWGNPTRNPLGWKSPCYLITDKYYGSYSELMEQTDWDRYEAHQDERCRDCMVHSGYEATVARKAASNPSDILRLLLWNLK
ncbi:MAG TPA: adenosyl-hopene transferase HpnH [Dissulfurispiraceae bacterium]|nr:adenosyl-hopene transferase HpnH [Dissulfurispiraceae bacterium]